VTLRYHEIAKRVETSVLPCSSFYLEQGDAGLTEDLIEGFAARFGQAGHDKHRYSVVSARELMRELDDQPADGAYKVIVCRLPEVVFTKRDTEAILWRLDRERRNARVRAVFMGDEPTGTVQSWFLNNDAYGIVTEPTFEKLGQWVATKTAGRWDYYKTGGALITPETGLRLAEHCGWDYTSLLQAAKTIRAYTSKVVEWPLVSALIPPKPGFGYADALVFGKGRQKALGLAEGITADQTLRTLGLVRYYLRQFARLRAIGVENMGDRRASEESGMHVWHLKTKYRPMYASFTNDRIRLRMAAVERAMAAARSGAGTGVLEVLVAEW